MNAKENIAIIVPAYNEVDNLESLTDEVAELRDRFPNLQLVFVDDGSNDGTSEMLDRLAAERDWLCAMHHARRRGQSAAMLTGLHGIEADIYGLLDGDGQNPPADLAFLLEKLAEADVVCGYRAQRRDNWSRKMASGLGNRIRNWITRDGLRDTGCSMKVFRAKCRKDLPLLDGMHRFMGAYFCLNGRRLLEVPVGHRPRQAGRSKYSNLSRLPRTLRDLAGYRWYQSRYLGRPQDD